MCIKVNIYNTVSADITNNTIASNHGDSMKLSSMVSEVNFELERLQIFGILDTSGFLKLSVDFWAII